MGSGPETTTIKSHSQNCINARKFCKERKSRNTKLMDNFSMVKRKVKKKKKQKKGMKPDSEQTIEEDKAYSSRELEEDF